MDRLQLQSEQALMCFIRCSLSWLNEVNAVDGRRAARDEYGGNSFGCLAVFEETASTLCSAKLFIGFRQCSISKIRGLNGCMVEYTWSPMILSNHWRQTAPSLTWSRQLVQDESHCINSLPFPPDPCGFSTAFAVVMVKPWAHPPIRCSEMQNPLESCIFTDFWWESAAFVGSSSTAPPELWRLFGSCWYRFQFLSVCLAS